MELCIGTTYHQIHVPRYASNHKPLRFDVNHDDGDVVATTDEENIVRNQFEHVQVVDRIDLPQQQQHQHQQQNCEPLTKTRTGSFVLSTEVNVAKSIGNINHSPMSTSTIHFT